MLGQVLNQLLGGQVIDFLPYLLKGVYWTLGLTLGSLGLGFIIGLPMATAQSFGGKNLTIPIAGYLWFFRGIPLIVFLFLFYYGIFPAMGLHLSALTTSIIVMGLQTGAYQSQIFRGGIKSVGRGQMRAARSLGMSKLRAIIHVIWPQALRVSLPGWSNEYAIWLKNSAICFALGVMETLTRARYITRATMKPLLPYIFAGILFIILTYSGTKIINFVYERVKCPGLVGGGM